MAIFLDGRELKAKPKPKLKWKCPFTGGECSSSNCIEICLKVRAATELTEEERKTQQVHVSRQRGPNARPPMRRDGQMVFNTESRAWERRGR